MQNLVSLMETVHISSPAWEYIIHQVEFLNQSQSLFTCKLPVAARQAPHFYEAFTSTSVFKGRVAEKVFQDYCF